MKISISLIWLCALLPSAHHAAEGIDRHALVCRHNPVVTAFDSLSSLSVGNGEFAFTVDATGLQTFPGFYSGGVPLGTQSQWGWHSFNNTENYRYEETLQTYDFGRGHLEPYPVLPGGKRKNEAANWFRANPHRLHLGIVGFELEESERAFHITDIRQQLDMWNGNIKSRFKYKGEEVQVETVCHPHMDMIAAHIITSKHMGIKFRFPYPTGKHSDDACDWSKNELHSTRLVSYTSQSATLERILDETTYRVVVRWKGKGKLIEKEKNYFLLMPEEDDFTFTCAFSPVPLTKPVPDFKATVKEAKKYWNKFWKEGGAVDFSACKDKRAYELERRVVLSEYLLAIQCAGSYPPQETGLTYNSWYGKFHLEMIWWHEVQFALWNRSHLLEKTLEWYKTSFLQGKKVAARQGFDGVRWMKMTDPSGLESPSGIGPFLIWQQPHFIYMAELIYRTNPSPRIVEKYNKLVQETAAFMYSFATYDSTRNRYILKGVIPAQETLSARETVNPPFELSYWHFGLSIAQKWRERAGNKRKPEWDVMMNRLSHLAYKDSLYLAAESAPDTYHNIRYTSDHMSVLGAYGILPASPLVQQEIMNHTLNWVYTYWNWNHTWGWDYPMSAMCAARLGLPQKAIDLLLMDKQTNTYLINGHNYQNNTLRIYLPGNGGLLTAIALMCAGWDNCKEKNPGFPADGNWEVKWENLNPLP